MVSPNRQASYTDFQARVLAFEVGTRVYTLLGGNPAISGVVVAVWPAIGMVDVQFPHGSTRYPVEDLIIDTRTEVKAPVPAGQDTVPGGLRTVSVPGGPLPGGPRQHLPNYNPPAKSPMEIAARTPVIPKTGRVVSAYIKKAVYWASVNRKYKMTKEECSSGKLCCPRCEDAYLRDVVYKREEGKSVRLLCCPECLFLLRRDDVLGIED